jgi:glycosyltransferase involved in cell wall biosynthesis
MLKGHTEGDTNSVMDSRGTERTDGPSSQSGPGASPAINPQNFVLSIVIPCFNEVQTIGRVVESVLNSEIRNKEIIIVDDASTDGTIELLRKEIEPLVAKVIYQPVNRGKGAALRTGFRHATDDIVLVQDADLEYDPHEYPKLVDPILKHGADVVYGSRLLTGQAHRVLYFWHMVGNKLLTLLSNMFTDLDLSDMETGYKVFKRSVIQSLTIEEDRFGFEPEITAKLAKKRLTFYEVGISYYGRTYEQGKKIGLKDAWRALYCILKYSLLK